MPVPKDNKNKKEKKNERARDRTVNLLIRTIKHVSHENYTGIGEANVKRLA